MMSKRTALSAFTIVVLLCVSRVFASSLVSSGNLGDMIAVEDVSVSDGVVSGVLVNKSQLLLRDVRLLIRHSWLWRNERAPGHNNPGRTESYTVPGEIPAGGRLPFSYTVEPPLPNRDDGTFETSVEVISLTQVG